MKEKVITRSSLTVSNTKNSCCKPTKMAKMANSKTEKEGRNWLKLASIQNLSAICGESNCELQNVKKNKKNTLLLKMIFAEVVKVQ